MKHNCVSVMDIYIYIYMIEVRMGGKVNRTINKVYQQAHDKVYYVLDYWVVANHVADDVI